MASHFNYPEFDDQVIDRSIEWAQGVGIKYVTLSMAKNAATMDEWRQNCDLTNKYGEKVPVWPSGTTLTPTSGERSTA